VTILFEGEEEKYTCLSVGWVGGRDVFWNGSPLLYPTVHMLFDSETDLFQLAYLKIFLSASL
jgi:hypothetical protein